MPASSGPGRNWPCSTSLSRPVRSTGCSLHRFSHLWLFLLLFLLFLLALLVALPPGPAPTFSRASVVLSVDLASCILTTFTSSSILATASAACVKRNQVRASAIRRVSSTLCFAIMSILPAASTDFFARVCVEGGVHSRSYWSCLRHRHC